MFGRELGQEIMEVLDFGVEVEVEGEVGAADGFEVVDFGEDVDCASTLDNLATNGVVLISTYPVDMVDEACLARKAVSC